MLAQSPVQSSPVLLLCSQGLLRLLTTQKHLYQDPHWEKLATNSSPMMKAASGQYIIQPCSSFCAQPGMNVPTAPHPSLSALSQLLTLIQGLGLYFKAISGLNRQLYQTLTLHLGATLTTIFLWDKAVQKALERACESWRQRIFILGYPAYGADLWRTTATSRTRPPLQNTANPFC